MADSRQTDKLRIYGGQAVLEGVFIRGLRRAAVAVRDPRGNIERREIQLPSWSTSRWRKVPFIRGIIILSESVVTGFRALTLSSLIAYDEEQPADTPRTRKQLISDRLQLAASLLVTLTLGIGIFVLLPIFATTWIDPSGYTGFLANVLEGLIRVILLLAYIWLIGYIKDIKRLYAYHGAEHKTIAAAEANADTDVESIRRYPKEHPRCGTAFLVTVALLALIIFSLFPREPLWLLITLRIVLIPVIMGCGYELIRLAFLLPNNIFGRIINFPNLLTQKLTTREPSDDMIEVALAALRYTEELDNDND